MSFRVKTTHKLLQGVTGSSAETPSTSSSTLSLFSDDKKDEFAYFPSMSSSKKIEENRPKTGSSGLAIRSVNSGIADRM